MRHLTFCFAFLSLLIGQGWAAIDCSIYPPIATNIVDDIHFFTVNVTTNGLPVGGIYVTASVISGPNTAETDTTPTTTDLNGDASFFYFSDGRPGTDIIRAIAFSSNTSTCTATKVWALTFNYPPFAFAQDIVTNAGPHCTVAVPATAVDDASFPSFDGDGEIVSYTLTPPGPFGIGSHEVTFTVEDDGGATASTNATITVVDGTPPVIFCPISIVTNLPPGLTNAIINFTLPLATDNCDNPIEVECEPSSGSTFPLGTTPILCTAADESGNTNQCVFDLILHETPAQTNDLTIAKLKGPKALKFSAIVTQVTSLATVTIVNLSPHDETINSYDGLVTLVAQSLGAACPDAIVALHSGPPNLPLPLTLAPRKKLNVAFDVTFNCINDPGKGTGHQDYRILATVNHSVLSTGDDSFPINDNCPRPPNPATGDKGCGGKGGTDILIDATAK